MKKSDFIILTDMDDVLENLAEAWVIELNNKYGHNVLVSDIHDWYIDSYFKGLSPDEIRSPLLDDDFWGHVKPRQDAVDVLRNLHDQGFSIYVVTSTDLRSVWSKMSKALWPYFPFIKMDNIIVCSNKQLIMGNVLVDDGVHNFNDFPVKPIYKKILFTASSNLYYNTVGTDITRVANWYEAQSTIERMFEEENGLEKTNL